MTPYSAFHRFVPTPPRRAPGPDRKRRRFSADSSAAGRILWCALFALLRLAALALAAAAAGLVIAAGLTLLLLPAQALGWLWFFILTILVLALGMVAADASAAVMRFIYRQGDRLLYGP